MKKPGPNRAKPVRTRPVLTISSKNYSSWSLRGWLLCRLAGLDVEEQVVSIDDPANRAELLLLAPSVLVPRLSHDGASVWDTLAIAEYLAELYPEAEMLPEDRIARAHCRSVAGEMHSSFYNLRSALPMNLKAHYKKFKVFAGAQADIDRIQAIWGECLERWGGPFLFGKPTIADAMFAPVCTRFLTYSVPMTEASKAYCHTIMSWPPMVEWVAAAKKEPEEMEELDMEF
jgi:glutathione S-transferase